jgi:MoaA/NifB/PqqE/SkfB family radical SAM enzyme
MNHENRQYLKVEELKDEIKSSDPFPCIIEIHPSRICNNSCKYCFHHDVLPKHSRIIPLNLENYKKLFEEMKTVGISNLSISGGGEPTMYKQLPDLINQAHKNSLNVRIVTNGISVNKELFDKIELIDEIRISLDAIKSSTYSKIRNIPENFFYKAMGNLKKIIYLRESKKLHLKVGVTFLLNEINYEEAINFCNEMLSLNVDSIIIKDDVYNKIKVPDSIKDLISTTIGKMSDNKIEFRESKNYPISRTKCFMPYFKVAVDTFGIVHSCCLAAQPDSKEGFILGNIRKDSLAEIWKNSHEKRFLARTHGVNCNFCNFTDLNLNNLFKN